MIITNPLSSYMMVQIDLFQYQTKQELFDELKVILELPPYFNANLDSLYEVLSCMQTPITIEFLNFSMFSKTFGDYALSFQACLNQVECDNSFIKVYFK